MTDPVEMGMACIESKAPSVTEGLEMKRDRLLSQLAEVQEALDALQANPEIERVLNLVNKAGRF